MTKVEVELNDDVISIIGKLENINDSGVELHIPEGSVLLSNILNLKLLRDKFDREGKSIHFTTSDEAGQDLIDMLSGNGEGSYFLESVGDFGFEEAEESYGVGLGAKIKRLIPISKIALPKLKLPLVVIVLIAVGVVFGGYTLSQAPKATVKIVVDSQPLARSVSIRVVKDATSNVEQKILSGMGVAASLVNSSELDTTGEKLVGEKAKGKIKVFNKTHEEIKLDSGTLVAFKGKSSDLFYILEDDVTIGPLSPQDPTDPSSLLVPGEAEVEVTAEKFGEDYNIKGDETLEFEDYKKSELEGKTEGDIKGGKSETIKVVTEEDRKKLSEELFAKNSEGIDDALKKNLDNNQKLVAGSAAVVISSDEFNHGVGDEVDKLSLVQTVNALGLAYSDKELKSLLEDMIRDLVPEGFSLSDEEFDVNTEVLGNSDDSVLSNTQADVQVTVKTFVLPVIDKEALSQSLAGKSVADAEKVLGSLGSIDTYELKISPGIPFLQKVPNDLDRVFVEVVRK